jgi:phosphoribosylaminoimidazolecarboxamide formyltransferase/IMP cyclohydrolase
MCELVIPIRRALLSVFDKQGLVELARFLAESGVELLASGGTQNALIASGVAVTDVAQYTGQAEVLGGRVKTLHPKIHAGILARRDVDGDLATLELQGFPLIDLVVVNLYPFQATIARADSTLAQAIETIDIGGPALIRGAAKNHEFVAVLTSHDQYPDIIAAIREHGGTRLAERQRLAVSAFELTSSYDRAIAGYLGQVNLAATASGPHHFPKTLDLHFELRQQLRYGENPHQQAAFYVEPAARGPNLATARILHGKELSYNNLLDLDSALRLVRQFTEPAACILKHNNPCGAATAGEPAAAFERAYEGDPQSAFGGIVALNREVDRATAERMGQPGRFLEAVLAPSFHPDARDWLTTKPPWRNSLRLIDLEGPVGPADAPPLGNDLRRVEGGLLVQDWDRLEAHPAAGSVPTRRAPTDAERRDLAFAWIVCAAVKSNAIVLARDRQVVGVGAGQMSRVDSVRIAAEKAGTRAQGAVLASDAFFPFRDGPDLAAAAGVSAIIQPGGSRRDDETIRACDQHGLAMILTGRRHFRH